MKSYREAMQQALEALKFGLHVGFDESSESQMKKGVKAFEQHSKAITALRECLAQAGECGECDYSFPCHKGATRCIREPVQEPVAYLWQHSETGRMRIVMPDQIITADATWFVVGPLFLAPPQPPKFPTMLRKMWSGTEVQQWIDKHWSAHGIGGEA